MNTTQILTQSRLNFLQLATRNSLLITGKRVKPAYDYFQQKFDNDLKVAVSIFKYARYFDPGKIGELKPFSSDVDNL